ncbi:MAG TPA: YihY/virulence factor BrkB family protein [Pirellulaceae bacterium]|nr:YihY/virulence factor BrkB family protein [Pirellulaceae bacterium]
MSGRIKFLPKSRLRRVWGIFADAATNFQTHGCGSMAAAVSYYTVFSLPGLLVVVISLAGFVLDSRDIEGRVARELRMVVGDVGAEQIQTIIQEADRPARGMWGTVFGGSMLLLGATAVMVQLQHSLNEIWQVIPRPGANPIKLFLVKRLLSLSMVMSFAFLLLVSLVTSTSISALGRTLEESLPGGVWETVLSMTNMIVAYAVVAAMFAVMYQYLPDVRLAWANVFVGACLTALLFSIGKGALAIYLAHSNIASLYGAAGSLALILVWVYYSSMIFLFGAEFTRAWTREYHGPAKPERGAVHVTRTIETTTPAASAQP